MSPGPEREDEKGRKILTLNAPLPLQLGGSLVGVNMSWEEWGPPGAPPVMVVPALSSSSHIAPSSKNPEKGWWEDLVGEGGYIDTKKYRVIVPNILGSSFGLVSPLSTNPLTGKPYGPLFPQITTADQAHLHNMLLEHLQIDKLYAMIGSSLGGMQVLQWGVQFPDKADKMIVISTTAATSPGSVAVRSVQRHAIVSDPELKGGYYREHNTWPYLGMKVARMMGIISYRSRSEFDSRFSHRIQQMPEAKSTDKLDFQMEDWLLEKSHPFASSFDPNCYLILSKCMDAHNVSVGIADTVAEALQKLHGKIYVIGVDTDTLIPVTEQRYIYQCLQEGGKDVIYDELSSLYGHDAFLHQESWFGPRIKSFLETGERFA